MAIHGESDGSRSNPGETEQLDRILLGVCAVLWLAALGAGVAAVVALVALGSGRSVGAEASGADTPWLLYSIIGLSAAVIVAAIPLLLRARRSNRDGVDARSHPRSSRSVFGDPVDTTKIRSFGGPAIRRHSTAPASSSRVAFHRGRRPGLAALLGDHLQCHWCVDRGDRHGDVPGGDGSSHRVVDFLRCCRGHHVGNARGAVVLPARAPQRPRLNRLVDQSSPRRHATTGQ